MSLHARLAIVLALWLSGCTSQVGEMALVAKRRIDLEQQVIVYGVEGEDCVRNLFFVPLGHLHTSLDRVIADALTEVPGAEGLANASFEESTTFTLVYNTTCLRVKGDAVRTHSPTQPASHSGPRPAPAPPKRPEVRRGSGLAAASVPEPGP